LAYHSCLLLLLTFTSLFLSADPPSPRIYTLSLHDALPISIPRPSRTCAGGCSTGPPASRRCSSSSATSRASRRPRSSSPTGSQRSEEHTSELQSRENLVCRLLLEKKKKHTTVLSKSL